MIKSELLCSWLLVYKHGRKATTPGGKHLDLGISIVKGGQSATNSRGRKNRTMLLFLVVVAGAVFKPRKDVQSSNAQNMIVCVD